MKKALIVLSGGQDSTTCLFWALDKGYECSAVTFNYNQLHSIEINCAKKISEIAKIKEHIIMDIGPIFSGDSPLTNPKKELETKKNLDSFDDGVQNTFIPSRNIVFLSLACNIAYVKGIDTIITGVCETDYAGYPDCRKDFILSLEQTVSLGLDMKINILTPLINLKKSEIVQLAYNLKNECWKALAYTHTSYCGCYPPIGNDHASLLREKGFKDAGLPDPLILRAYREGLIVLPNTANYENKS